MKRFNLLQLCSLVSLFTVTLALFPSTLQAQWVYVNDNNYASSGSNTAYGFKNSGTALGPIGGEPALGWPSHGTSVVHTDALKDQALYKFSSTEACLFVSEPLPSAGDPHGDIAAFFVNTITGKLTLTARYPTPAGISTQWGIALTTRKTPPTLYAGYSDTGNNKIGVWSIANTKCELKFAHQKAVHPLNGGEITGMAEAPNGHTLVVAYVDGSIQSFNTPGYTINSAGSCAVAVDSTGFLDGNGGLPDGVDITADSLYAILGDVTGTSTPHGPTELEVVPLPITCSTTTTDFGGTIVASNTYLGSNIDSTNVWLSPNEHFIYATNNGPNTPQGFTTVAYAEPYGLALASGCTSGYANPISLISPGSGFFEPNGIQTRATTGNGAQVYVGEYRTLAPYSAVALLDLDASGCTQEVSGSPFHDPNGAGGASQLSAWPPRPF